MLVQRNEKSIDCPRRNGHFSRRRNGATAVELYRAQAGSGHHDIVACPQDGNVALGRDSRDLSSARSVMASLGGTSQNLKRAIDAGPSIFVQKAEHDARSANIVRRILRGDHAYRLLEVPSRRRLSHPAVPRLLGPGASAKVKIGNLAINAGYMAAAQVEEVQRAAETRSSFRGSRPWRRYL